jgi:hypothetical protein
MIIVTFWDDREKPSTVVEVPEGRDPFAVCAQVSARLGLKPSERDERFERVMLARNPAQQESRPKAATSVERQPKQPPARVGLRENAAPRDTGSATVEVREPAVAASRVVRDASMAAYRALAWSGTMAAQQRAVLDVFLRDPERTWTRRELVNAVGIPVNAVTGRVNELLKEPFELIEECGKRSCSMTGETVNELRLKRNA